MRLKARVTSLAAALALAATMGLASANQSVAADACTGKSAGTVFRWYTPRVPLAAVPLRCGTSAWGYNHIKARFADPLFDSYIVATLKYYTTTRRAGTSTTYYARPVMPCTSLPYFKVVVEYAPYGSGPKGIITATPDRGPGLASTPVPPQVAAAC